MTPSLPLLSLLLAALAAGSLAGSAARAQAAPAYPVTVIVSDLGSAAARGRLERQVAEAWEARQRRLGGVFGRDVEVRVVSDAGDPERALRAAREATGEGALALVCCSTPEATARVAPFAAGAQVPLLSPAGEGAPEAAGWQFALTPSRRTHLQAAVVDMYRHGITGIGLLAPDDASGDAARLALGQFIATDAMRVVADVRYAPDAEVLTPEALLVATREPGAILAWDGREGVVLALEGLRERGWRGPVYVPGTLLDPPARGLPAAFRGDVRVAVSPAVVEGAVPPTDPRASWILDARELAGGRVGSSPFAADGAIVHDALVLLGMALERASVYGVAPEETRSFRFALRDALVSLGPVGLAAGTYDPSMDAADAALASGLVVARPSGSGLTPVP